MKCKHCDFFTKSQQIMNNHLRQVHNLYKRRKLNSNSSNSSNRTSQSSNSFKCTMCSNVSFKTAQELVDHLNDEHVTLRRKPKS